MKQITLNECIRMMDKINQSEDFECFFENGRMIIQSKFIIVEGGQNGTI